MAPWSVARCHILQQVGEVVPLPAGPSAAVPALPLVPDVRADPTPRPAGEGITRPAEASRLLLLLAAGSQLYAIDSEQVVEVIPRVMLRPVSGAPPHRPGVFNFRGRVVPVLDVSQLIAGETCAAHLSSRIIMVRLGEPDSGSALLGLLAERVTDTLLKPLSSFQPAEGATDVRPFLGGVALDERGLIQLLHVERLAREALGEPLRPVGSAAGAAVPTDPCAGSLASSQAEADAGG